MKKNVIKTAAAVALGSFDGVHLGHRAVLEAAAAGKARGLLPVALVFDEHPQKALTGTSPPYLCGAELRDRLFCEMGLEARVLSFANLRDMPPEKFFTDILISEFNAGFVSCGADYKFGSGGKGDVRLMGALCRERGAELCVADEVRLDGLRVSSTNIRRALTEGDTELANRMLGREFSFCFTVVSGERRGRRLGAPTINQLFPEDFIVPKYGVYASRAFVDGKWLPSMTNIGVRPTVAHEKPLTANASILTPGSAAPGCETCILDFSGDLYGQNIEVALVKYLRPEMRFDSLEALSAQIKSDAAAVRGMGL